MILQKEVIDAALRFMLNIMLNILQIISMCRVNSYRQQCLFKALPVGSDITTWTILKEPYDDKPEWLVIYLTGPAAFSPHQREELHRNVSNGALVG